MKGLVIGLGLALIAYGVVRAVVGSGQPLDVAILLSGIVAVGWGVFRLSKWS